MVSQTLALIMMACFIRAAGILEVCQGKKRSTPWSLGMGDLQPLMTGILIMGPYKPLRTWVDDHPLLYGNNGV